LAIRNLLNKTILNKNEFPYTFKDYTHILDFILRLIYCQKILKTEPGTVNFMLPVPGC